MEDFPNFLSLRSFLNLCNKSYSVLAHAYLHMHFSLRRYLCAPQGALKLLGSSNSPASTS
jgi:hypothetical protein